MELNYGEYQANTKGSSVIMRDDCIVLILSERSVEECYNKVYNEVRSNIQQIQCVKKRVNNKRK